ncbi:hypothetical protein F4777DRAFT_391193 [Nemania sp. FL0916]|nr:hypothetical protein F4777DRAFT_391193 [Nemania sp. FL0916]
MRHARQLRNRTRVGAMWCQLQVLSIKLAQDLNRHYWLGGVVGSGLGNFHMPEPQRTTRSNQSTICTFPIFQSRFLNYSRELRVCSQMTRAQFLGNGKPGEHVHMTVRHFSPRGRDMPTVLLPGLWICVAYSVVLVGVILADKQATVHCRL